VTYSIVARDPASGDLGIAVQSKFLAVGSVVPWARAGVGAIATQSFANVAYGPDGLGLLASGASASEVVARLIAADDLRDERQVGIVDAHGGAANHTGGACFAWAGGRTGAGFAAQGNILAGAGVVDGLADTYIAGGRPFPELLVACLAAADAAGGDRRGRESAVLYVVREGAGYGGGNDRWIDLRVDDHPDPIGELERILKLARLYTDRPSPEELIPVDAALAGELRAVLKDLGWAPGGRTAPVYPPMSASNTPAADRPFVGLPRPLADGWDDAWQTALLGWMAVENLEERAAAPGWIDPLVLGHLRTRVRPMDPPAGRASR
jgi:uncharacterized Ntn-hydrolase superfamily protein